MSKLLKVQSTNLQVDSIASNRSKGVTPASGQNNGG